VTAISPTDYHGNDLQRLLLRNGRHLGQRLKLAATAREHRRLRWGAAAFGLVVIVVMVALWLFDWNMLRGPISRFASARMQREVRIEGDLDVKLFSRAPTATVERLTIGQPQWVKDRGVKGPMAAAQQVKVSVKLWPLFRGKVEIPLIEVTRPGVALLADKKGLNNWTFGGPRDPNAKPLKLPPIQTFIISNGRLLFIDEGRGIRLDAGIEAHEEASSAYAKGFTMKGNGSINRAPFTLDVTGGPLINVRSDRPYPFNADVRAGSTRITANGQVVRPFDLGRVTGSLGIQGKDLADLYLVTGLTLPNTPPYRVNGRFDRNGTRYTYDDFSGKVGTSDLAGDVAVETKGERPYLTGDIRSRVLDFADLGAIFGAPGASKVATPDQKAEVRQLVAQERIFPDAPLDVARLRAMDADVKYRAESVRAPNGLPLRAVSVTTNLKAGVLKLDPVRLTMPHGRVSGNATIDGRKDTPFSSMDFRIADVTLQDYLPAVGGAEPITGAVRARVRLRGPGNSIHKFASNADGAVTGVIPHGEMRQAFAELLGIDATKGLFMLLSKDQSPTPVRCAIADFRVSNGVMTADRMVFDTGVVVAQGSGKVNLGQETYDLRIKGAPKKLRAVRVIAPITVKGPLKAPNFGIEPGAAIAQAGIGAALGSLLTPLAAIIPFVDPGLAKNADCAALFAEARQSNAAVNAPKNTPVPPTGGKKVSVDPVGEKKKG
jgi:uncharacterized protein involved in outer membrane biogenesis